MTNFLIEFQNSAGQLAPVVLQMLGFVLVWLGLCLWIGGLRWLKFFAGLSAAAIGYAAAYFFTGRQFYFLVGIPVLAGLAAICFEKVTAVLLTGILTASVVNLVLAWPTLNDPATWRNPPVINPPAVGQEAAAVESLTVMENYTVWIGRTLYNTIKTLGSVNWAVYGIVILVIAALGLIIPRALCALLCSMVGVTMIADGMFLLLIDKGSKPADIFLANPGLFELIAAGMVVFGVLVNLALAPAKSRKKPVSEPNVE